MKRFATAAIAALVVTACADEAQDPVSPSFSSGRPESGTVWVTSSADGGSGSFRAALAEANANPRIGRIRFDRRIRSITLTSPLVYSGPQSLRIEGEKAELKAGGLGAGQTALLADGGADLYLGGLTVRNAPGVGITVAVPAGRTGTIEVVLDEIRAFDNGLHGVLINDQSEYFSDPNSTAETGSAASVSVKVWGSRFERNGFAAIDQDGLRVNEGGEGDLKAEIRNTVVLGNGGDGVELDERSNGSADFSVHRTDFLANGAFDPADYDDGIDVDEAGAGNLVGEFVQVRANDNFEQGIDLNENDAGNLEVRMTRVWGSNNAEEGIEFEEDDDFAGGGDLIATLVDVTANGNGAADGDAGLKLREKGEGNLRARIISPKTNENVIGGIQVREDSNGDLWAEIINAVATGNGADGIEFDENSGGNLDASVRRAHVTGNTDAGIAATQATTGTGLLTIRALRASGNGEGDVVPDAGVVVDDGV